MRKALIAIALVALCALVHSLYLSHELAKIKATQIQMAQYVEALDQKVNALEYKKNAQLYLLCTDPSDKTMKLLADSCKADCLKYKHSK